MHAVQKQSFVANLLPYSQETDCVSVGVVCHTLGSHYNALHAYLHVCVYVCPWACHGYHVRGFLYLPSFCEYCLQSHSKLLRQHCNCFHMSKCRRLTGLHPPLVPFLVPFPPRPRRPPPPLMCHRQHTANHPTLDTTCAYVQIQERSPEDEVLEANLDSVDDQHQHARFCTTLGEEDSRYHPTACKQDLVLTCPPADECSVSTLIACNGANAALVCSHNMGSCKSWRSSHTTV